MSLNDPRSDISNAPHHEELTAMHNIGQIDREISRSRETTDRDGEGASDDHQT